MRVSDVLSRDQILLDLPAPTREEAVHRVAEMLRGDPRVKDWPAFFQSLREREEKAKVNLEYGLCFPHARTDAVTDMVMAFGRLAQPVMSNGHNVRFILVIGIPDTLDAEYLRMVGALMRVFRDRRTREILATASTPEEIVSVFEGGETSLESAPVDGRR
jgi:mannitol/fructose-specific phosphotransferase system IIA component (Ntr-type)